MAEKKCIAKETKTRWRISRNELLFYVGLKHKEIIKVMYAFRENSFAWRGIRKISVWNKFKKYEKNC